MGYLVSSGFSGPYAELHANANLWSSSAIESTSFGLLKGGHFGGSNGPFENRSPQIRSQRLYSAPTMVEPGSTGLSGYLRRLLLPRQVKKNWTQFKWHLLARGQQRHVFRLHQFDCVVPQINLYAAP